MVAGMASRDQKTRYGFPPERDPYEVFPDMPPWDTPLVDLSNWWLEIRCVCGRFSVYPLRLLAANVGWRKTLRQVVPLLKCDEVRCRRRPETVRLVSDSGGERGRGGAKVHAHDLSGAISRDSTPDR